MFRAFYLPPNNRSEVFEDKAQQNQLTAGAILVIQINEDGTRQLISEKKNATPTEQEAIDYGKRQLEFKHDGGDSREMISRRKENRGSGS